MKLIKIKWFGPYNQEFIRTSNKKDDYGVYQIYGNHKIYGKNVLLYIGKAQAQTFGFRIPQHIEWFDWEDIELKFYLGKICKEDNEKEVDNEDWDKQINCAEKALIHYCQPAWNSSGLNTNSSTDYFEEFIIFNFGKKVDLPEEIIVCNEKKKVFENINNLIPKITK